MALRLSNEPTFIRIQARPSQVARKKYMHGDTQVNTWLHAALGAHAAEVPHRLAKIFTLYKMCMPSKTKIDSSDMHAIV
jgi:hypothetical protein